MAGMRSTFPLFPTDEGWPYPDADEHVVLASHSYTDDDEIDLDVLELRADPHAFDGLTPLERDALQRRYRDGSSMRDLARRLGCTRAEAAAVLGAAIEKVRRRLAAP